MVKKLRTFYGKNDDLQEFAEAFLNRPSYLSDCLSMIDSDGAAVAVVCKEGAFQVELCFTPGGLLIPDHIHPHADTIEVGIAGGLRLKVNGVDPFGDMPDEVVARRGKWRGVRINHDDWHGTFVRRPGAFFFSIQKWLDGVTRSVLTDYEGARLGPQHECV